MIVYPRNKLLPGHIEVLWKKQLDDRDLGGEIKCVCIGVLPTITGVAQWYERQTFNLVVRGSIPLIGITEGDTAQGAKTNMVQTIFSLHYFSGQECASYIF